MSSPHLELRWETHGSSPVATGISGFLLSCDEDLREPFGLPQGSQGSFLVERGTSGFLSSHCMGIGPHLMLRHETPLSSRVVRRVSVLMSR